MKEIVGLILNFVLGVGAGLLGARVLSIAHGLGGALVPRVVMNLVGVGIMLFGVVVLNIAFDAVEEYMFRRR